MIFFIVGIVSSHSARKSKCPSSARNLHSSARLEPENSSSGSSLQYLYMFIRNFSLLCVPRRKTTETECVTFLVGNRECNTDRGFKNQLYIELGGWSLSKLKLTFTYHIFGSDGDFVGTFFTKAVVNVIKTVIKNCGSKEYHSNDKHCKTNF